MAISTSMVSSNMHPESHASLAGDIVPWARYTVEFWSMRPQSVPMTCLQFAGPNVALKKLCGKQLAPGFRCIDWTSRPLTAEQVNHAGQYSAHFLFSVRFSLLNMFVQTFSLFPFHSRGSIFSGEHLRGLVE
jgi:hypothetical protein